MVLTVGAEPPRDVGPAAVARVDVAVRLVLRVVQHGEPLHLVDEPLAVLARRRRRHRAAPAPPPTKPAAALQLTIQPFLQKYAAIRFSVLVLVLSVAPSRVK